jgi:hypothetical protein
VGVPGLVEIFLLEVRAAEDKALVETTSVNQLLELTGLVAVAEETTTLVTLKLVVLEL